MEKKLPSGLLMGRRQSSALKEVACHEAGKFLRGMMQGGD